MTEKLIGWSVFALCIASTLFVIVVAVAIGIDAFKSWFKK